MCQSSTIFSSVPFYFFGLDANEFLQGRGRSSCRRACWSRAVSRIVSNGSDRTMVSKTTDTIFMEEGKNSCLDGGCIMHAWM